MARTGNLRKEYVYGGATLITIEPTAVNSNGTQYTTSDNLGSPRVITNSGASVVSRHDYMPFGTELGAGTGGRTTGMGFSNSGDTNRKKFTGYERDNETGLDFAQARYYSNTQGRFSSPDPLQSSAKLTDPQSWNRYSYVGNNPMVFSDPSGMSAKPGGRNISNWNGAMASEQATDGISPWPDAAPEEAPSQPQQTQSQQQTPVTTQSATLSDAPNCHMCFGQIPTTVVVDQMNNPGVRVRDVNGAETLVVGVDLRITFLDQNGDPVTGTVSETVQPAVIQSTGAVPLDPQGRGGDLVSNALPGRVPVTASEQNNAIQYFNKDFTTSQTVTFAVVPNNGMAATVTQQRSLTNMVSGAPVIAGRIRGYTFTMEQPRIRIP